MSRYRVLYCQDDCFASHPKSLMPETLDSQVNRPGESVLPETPHEVPFDRGVIDALVDRVRGGERVNLLEAVLDTLDWSSFATTEGEPLDADARDELRRYYREKWQTSGRSTWPSCSRPSS